MTTIDELEIKAMSLQAQLNAVKFDLHAALVEASPHKLGDIWVMLDKRTGKTRRGQVVGFRVSRRNVVPILRLYKTDGKPGAREVLMWHSSGWVKES